MENIVQKNSYSSSRLSIGDQCQNNFHVFEGWLLLLRVVTEYGTQPGRWTITHETHDPRPSLEGFYRSPHPWGNAFSEDTQS